LNPSASVQTGCSSTQIARSGRKSAGRGSACRRLLAPDSQCLAATTGGLRASARGSASRARSCLQAPNTTMLDNADPRHAAGRVAGLVNTVHKRCIIFLVSFKGAEFPMPNQRRNASAPTTVNCTVRKYLTAREIEKLMDYARKHSRYGHRDSTMVLVAYRHGLRASEVCDLQWHQVELDQGRMHVRRAKNGTPSVHPIRGDEIRALRKLGRENPNEAYVFVTERGGPMSTIGFHHLIQRLGKAAKMPFSLHPHMLRHACGYKLANDGHDTRALQHYLGHKNIQHTVRYTELSPDRFRDFWRD
jgi:type 1 fimbriae regulatory protein FimE